VNHPHVESSESIWSRHLGVVDQEDVEKVMKIQDLSEFINKFETVKVFLAHLDLLIVLRLFIFSSCLADYSSIIEHVESLNIGYC